MEKTEQAIEKICADEEDSYSNDSDQIGSLLEDTKPTTSAAVVEPKSSQKDTEAESKKDDENNQCDEDSLNSDIHTDISEDSINEAIRLDKNKETGEFD